MLINTGPAPVLTPASAPGFSSGFSPESTPGFGVDSRGVDPRVCAAGVYTWIYTWVYTWIYTYVCASGVRTWMLSKRVCVWV